MDLEPIGSEAFGPSARALLPRSFDGCQIVVRIETALRTVGHALEATVARRTPST